VLNRSPWDSRVPGSENFSQIFLKKRVLKKYFFETALGLNMHDQGRVNHVEDHRPTPIQKWNQRRGTTKWKQNYTMNPSNQAS